MDKIVIIMPRYVISCIDITNWCHVRFFFYIEQLFSLSSHVWSITYPEFWRDSIYSLALYQFLFENKWVYLMNFWYERWYEEGLISYNIITVWCIRIICLTTVDMWLNCNTSPILRLVCNLPPLFSSWWRRHHEYLFYFSKTVTPYNQS